MFKFLQIFVLSTILLLSPYSSNASSGLERATREVQQQTQGRILSAKTVRQKNMYRIKVLMPSGKVKVYERRHER